MDAATLQAWPDNLECNPPVLYTGAYQGMSGSLQPSKGSGGPYSDAVSSGSGDSHLYANKEAGRANSSGSGDAGKPVVISVASAKNRAAQRRYRERQKGKMETFKSQVDELSHRLQQLQSEKDSLESRNRMLERVMQIKGDLDGAATDSWLTPRQPGLTEESQAALAGMVNSVRALSGKRITSQEMQDLQLAQTNNNAKWSYEFMKMIRAEYISQVAEQMVVHGDRPGTEGYRRLEEYILGHRMAKIKMLSSMSPKTFAQVQANRARFHINPPPTRQNIESLKLTPAQKKAYIRVRKEHLERKAQIQEKREVIAKELAAVPTTLPEGHAQQDVMLRALEASEAYRASLEEEHRSMIEFHISGLQVITPIQEGRAHLEVYPNMPDMYMVTAYLEAEDQGTLDQWLKEQEDAHAFRMQQRREAEGVPSVNGPTLSGDNSEASTFTCQICTGAALEFARNSGVKSENHVCEVLQTSDGEVKPFLEPLPLQAPPIEPTQLPSQQPTPLQDPLIELPDPSLDVFGDDDMWLDMFPGLASMDAV